MTRVMYFYLKHRADAQKRNYAIFTPFKNPHGIKCHSHICCACWEYQPLLKLQSEKHWFMFRIRTHQSNNISTIWASDRSDRYCLPQQQRPRQGGLPKLSKPANHTVDLTHSPALRTTTRNTLTCNTDMKRFNRQCVFFPNHFFFYSSPLSFILSEKELAPLLYIRSETENCVTVEAEN